MRLTFAAAGPVFSLLFLSGCSAVGTPEPTCRPLEVAEFPLLGGIRGTWMDAERFVLADMHQSRLLVYSTSEGLVRVVNGWESEDLELNFVSPADIQPWEDGYLLADGSTDQDRLLGLDADLRPVRVLWESDIEKGTGKWRGEEVFTLSTMVALRDRLYVQASRLSDGEHSEREYAEFGAARQPHRSGGALRELAAWPGFEGERYWYGSLHDLATTGGRGAAVFALRFAPAGAFVQELVGDGRRLEAFPELPAPMPVLPRYGPEGATPSMRRWSRPAIQPASSPTQTASMCSCGTRRVANRSGTCTGSTHDETRSLARSACRPTRPT